MATRILGWYEYRGITKPTTERRYQRAVDRAIAQGVFFDTGRHVSAYRFVRSLRRYGFTDGAHRA